jgi:hypothetical protein
MQEDVLKTMGSQIVGGARDEVISEVLDFVADSAKDELERRHPGLSSETSESKALARAITSDDLDSQVPKS